MPATGISAAPLQYLTGAGGAKTAPVVALTWGVLLISIAVILIIAGLLAAALWRRRAPAAATALAPDTGGHRWLWIGAGLSALALLVTVIWTVVVLAKVQAPPTRPAVAIQVTGLQWWWRVTYISADGTPAFTTANEIHIPTGVPVRLKLVGGDVIHSFWAPQLGGKMDTIPGQTNESWIMAERPGVYTGQCAEYCGVQHARMLLRVIAQSPADFRAWQAHQAAAPTVPANADFVAHCGNCHAVRGTDAAGTLGPDLSHLMQRRTLASGVLPNDEATLSHWIRDPQSLKPGNRMPAVTLTADEHTRILTYLKALQ